MRTEWRSIMKITKILSLVMAAVLIIALVGCGAQKRERIELTLNTEDAEAILKAAGIWLPEKEDAKGTDTTLIWYANYDFYAYSEDEMSQLGFFTFKEKYGGDVEWWQMVWETRWDQLANYILGGTPPDFTQSNNEMFPKKIIRGMAQPVNDYINYDDPLWEEMKPYAEAYFTLGGNTYMIVTDIGVDLVVPYNRRTINEWGFDDPAELFYNDQWTWDKFYDMCLEFTDPDEDRYALDGWYFGRTIMRSTGTNVVNYDIDTGHFVSNVDDPRLERAAQVCYDIGRNGLCYPWWNGWSLRNGVDGGGMAEGTCLFSPIGIWGFTGGGYEAVTAVWGDAAQDELMFVPAPRDPNGDGKYYLPASASGYYIINGAAHPEGVALLATCERFKAVDPTVVGIDRYQYEHTMHWRQDMLEMYDTCIEIANSGVGNIIMAYGEDNQAGYGTDVGEMLRYFNDDLAHPTSLGGNQTWAQAKEAYGDTFTYNIEQLNKDIDTFIANGMKAEPSAGN